MKSHLNRERKSASDALPKASNNILIREKLGQVGRQRCRLGFLSSCLLSLITEKSTMTFVVYVSSHIMCREIYVAFHYVRTIQDPRPCVHWASSDPPATGTAVIITTWSNR